MEQPQANARGPLGETGLGLEKVRLHAVFCLVRLADVSPGSVYRGVEERMREFERRIAALEEKVGR